ncbi:carbohydrate binding domain-containing protein [Halobacillus litoralis]|uniref:carbohydrate binding domain-containing protein n=1 Tax=Halobacillus litoralis TaxID=45668 RepID=UPI001CD3A99F|nr:carbohydrate binding domain-containing protein [Halobacillus litoralis]MCA0972275.1 carbohydrate binding domain-containing protein [Halobacillus litoralis]
MRKVLLICLMFMLSFAGAAQVFAEKKTTEGPDWLDEKSFYPPHANAAMSKVAFIDFLNQWVGVNGENPLETAESIGYLPEFKGSEKSVIKQGEAFEALSTLYPVVDWAEPENDRKPVKLGDAMQYAESVAKVVYTEGEHQDETVEGNAWINQPGVTLKNVTIEGNLYITRGAASGETLLDSVTVEGTLYIEEPAQNSVKLIQSEIGQTEIYKVGQQASDWSLVWGDEFLTEQIDSSKWRYDTGNWIVDENGEGVSPGWGNNEQQYYTDSPENSYIEDGKLVIEAKEEQKSDDFGTYEYTSAKLKTEDLFSKKYGKFEARMKLPEGQGYWPAFWMMPEDSVYGDWPASGEIDIMEAAGKDTSTIGGTIHYGEEYPNNTYRGKEYHFPEGSDYTGFHTYSIEWEPGEIRWYVDGELYQTLNNWFSQGPDEAANYTFPAPFDQEFYLILNLAVGGWYGGDADETTEFPGKMEVDYVRVYELTGRDYQEPVEPTKELEELPEEAKQPLEDGNLIYDQDYEQGFTVIDENEDVVDETYWNFFTLPDFAGEGSISTDTVDGTNFAKVDITNPGNALWSLQLIQKLAIVEGHTYEVTFDAKSNTNRSVMTKVSGGAERGYANYSGEQTFDLTSNVESHSYTFTHNQETDLAARLEFNMGTSTAPVWIGNVRVEDVTGEQQESTQKEPLPDGNHVYNGTFDQGDFSRLVYWETIAQNGAEADAVVTAADRVMQMDIEKPGASLEDIQFKQTGIQLLKGNTYELTFSARADEADEIAVGFVSQDGDRYAEAKPVSLSEEWSTYTVPFEMTTEASDLESQLIFYMGEAEADIYLDDVELIQTSTYVDYDNIDLLPLSEDFSDGMAGWAPYIHFDANATVDVKDEALNIDIVEAGQELWSVLPEYPGLELYEGVTYELSFDAKSSVPRDVEVTLENASYQRFLGEMVSLTGAFETFTYTFTMPQTETVSLKYLMGQFAEAHTIQLDNVQIEVQQD